MLPLAGRPIVEQMFYNANRSGTGLQGMKEIGQTEGLTERQTKGKSKGPDIMSGPASEEFLAGISRPCAK